MRHLSVLLPVLLAGFTFSATPVAAQDVDDTRTVSVSGEGIVHAEPDMATVRFGVVTHADDPEEARRQNAEASREAMNAVRELGVPERKMRMEVLRLQPHREYDPEQRRHVENGFEAIRIVVVELEDLDVLPMLIAEVVQRGANRLEGVQYDIQDRSGPRNEALRAALMDARDKARLMAETLEIQLGQVRRINEQQFDFPRPMMRMEAAMDVAGAEPEAFAAGEIEVRANVQVVFELQ